MPASLYSHPGSKINCVLTEQHWGENSSIHGWECLIFLNICQQIPLKEQMQQYINVMNKLPGYSHPHFCAAELHCCPKPIKNTLLSLTTAPDDTDEHRLLFISVKLSILLWNSLWKSAMIQIWKRRYYKKFLHLLPVAAVCIRWRAKSIILRVSVAIFCPLLKLQPQIL